MKKIYYLSLFLLLVSCGPDADRVRQEIRTLQTKVENLKNEKSTLQSKVNSLKAESQEIESRTTHLKNIEDGKVPTYLVEVKLKQKRISTDLGKHFKDSMNATEFWLPVDEKYFNSLSIGESLLNNFRLGSLVVNGTSSSWSIKVIQKKIEYR